MLTERTKLRRREGRGVHDPATIFGILDAALVSHVGFVARGQPYVIPTMHVRLEDRLYFHGAPANRMLGTLSRGVPCCLTATLVDGLVLGRSAFRHSLNYRSVVVLGVAEAVTDADEALASLHALVEKVQPGRWSGCRPPSPEELRATAIVRLPVVEASAKIRSGPPMDLEADLALSHWAGVVPLRTVHGAPEPDPTLRAGIPFPHS
ncbi:MAG TPA: pyridoxamine 5'-phosphate oxidase family protein [Polyangiaceae bacterium]|nr:pyridoxamine 5'-phosphate oxidase family protein [Polyangiaceae bacterium]